ncbi:MAG TPA: radical SAM protein [Candidatus Pelethosoma merdigallinarum]|nr:radical SAM protein [Candidatus Pelethosoma merdigallinarum]
MYLIKEIEFIDYNDNEVIMINLINGATDIIEKDIYDKIISNEFNKLDQTIVNSLLERKYLFENEVEYNNFIASVDARIEELEKKATPNFLVVPSYACNLQCIYCYEQTYMIKGTTDIDPLKMVDLQFERIDKIMEVYENKHGKTTDDIRITIMGGEPLLRCNIKTISYIFEQTKKRNYTLDIVSNGVDLNHYIDLFNKYKDTLDHIQITVDGVKEIHDKRRIFRDGRGSFDLIMNNIHLSIENGITIVLRVNVDATNINELSQLADTLVKEFNYNEKLLPYLYLLQDGGCSGEANIVNEKIGIEKIFELEDKNSNMSIFRKKFHPADFIESIFNDVPYQPVLRHCGASKNQFILDCKSNVYKCWHGIGNNDYRVGTFYPKYELDEEKINAWFNRSVRVLGKCKNCKYRYICGTGCPAAKHMSENNMNIKEPSCVEYNELIKTIILEKMKRI